MSDWPGKPVVLPCGERSHDFRVLLPESAAWQSLGRETMAGLAVDEDGGEVFVALLETGAGRLRVFVARSEAGIDSHSQTVTSGSFGKERWNAAIDFLRDETSGRQCVDSIGALALKTRTLLKACLVEIYPRPPDDAARRDADVPASLRGHVANIESDFIYTDVTTAGLPAPMLLRDGEISFPVRAWFPFGLMEECHSNQQNLDAEDGDHLFLFLDWERDVSMREFHASLQKSPDLNDLGFEACVAAVHFGVK